MVVCTCTRPVHRSITAVHGLYRPCSRLCTGRVQVYTTAYMVVYMVVYMYTRPVYETYRICNFLTNCYIRKLSKAPYCLSPKVYYGRPAYSRCGHYIFVLFLSFFLSFFPRLISGVADWMSTESPKIRHLGTIAQLCRAISAQLRHVSTIRKNLLNSNVSPHVLTIWWSSAY